MNDYCYAILTDFSFQALKEILNVECFKVGLGPQALVRIFFHLLLLSFNNFSSEWIVLEWNIRKTLSLLNLKKNFFHLFSSFSLFSYNFHLSCSLYWIKVGSYGAITSNGALVAAKTPVEVQREIASLLQVPVVAGTVNR